MRINPIVTQIVCASNVDHFLAVEVRTAYLALLDDKSFDPNKARRFVYAELMKLVKQGWLKKSVSKKKEATSFIKTELFDAALLIKNAGINLSKNEVLNHKYDETFGELINRLNHYKNDLLAGLGEVDEYKRLCEQFPSLQKELQPKYNNAREANSKLIGCIKAIESVIEEGIKKNYET